MSAARARSVGRPKKGVKPDRDQSEGKDAYRVAILYMRGSPEYFEALDLAQKKTGIAKVQIFRFAFADWCEKMGLDKPPEI